METSFIGFKNFARLWIFIVFFIIIFGNPSVALPPSILHKNKFNSEINYLTRLLADKITQRNKNNMVYKRYIPPFLPMAFFRAPNLGDRAKSLRLVRSSQKGHLDKNGKFIPSISVGALSDLQGFFDNLGQNLDTLESERLTKDQVKYLEGTGIDHNLRREIVDEIPSKPTGSAAFLHAIRNYRPSHRIRSLVSVYPEGYENTNFHDPNYLWAGLGK